MTPAIVQLQRKEEAKFICSACGADRGCQCNAPAVEKLAKLTEQRRQAYRTYDEKKRQRKQQSSDIGQADPDAERDRKECVALNQKVIEAERELAEASGDDFLKLAEQAADLAEVFAASLKEYPNSLTAEAIRGVYRVVDRWSALLKATAAARGAS